MNTIGMAMHFGELECGIISWAEFKTCYTHPCTDCKFVSTEEDGHKICTLFDSPYNSVEPEPALLSSPSSLMSVIIKCSLKREAAI